jgi:hypothetical protein
VIEHCGSQASAGADFGFVGSAELGAGLPGAVSPDFGDETSFAAGASGAPDEGALGVAGLVAVSVDGAFVRGVPEAGFEGSCVGASARGFSRGFFGGVLWVDDD